MVPITTLVMMHSYLVPLLQIYFRKLKLKLEGKCVEESSPHQKRAYKSDVNVLGMSKQCINSKKCREKYIWHDLQDYKNISGISSPAD